MTLVINCISKLQIQGSRFQTRLFAGDRAPEYIYEGTFPGSICHSEHQGVGGHKGGPPNQRSAIPPCGSPTRSAKYISGNPPETQVWFGRRAWMDRTRATWWGPKLSQNHHIFHINYDSLRNLCIHKECPRRSGLCSRGEIPCHQTDIHVSWGNWGRTAVFHTKGIPRREECTAGLGLHCCLWDGCRSPGHPPNHPLGSGKDNAESLAGSGQSWSWWSKGQCHLVP